MKKATSILNIEDHLYEAWREEEVGEYEGSEA